MIAEDRDVRITHSVRIERPPEDVWAVVSDPSTHAAWRPALVEFRQVSDGPLGVGSQIHEVIGFRGREIEIEDVVTAFEPPYRLGLRGSWKAADFELDVLLEPAGEHATVATFDWPLYPKTLLLRLAAPLLRGTMHRSTVEEADGLKRYVEARAGSRAPVAERASG